MEGRMNEIIHGDCIATLNAMQGEWCDLCFADPPFNIGYEYDGYTDKLSPAEYRRWSRQWIAAVYRALRPHGQFFLAINDDWAADLMKISIRELFFRRDWIIWHYSFGQNQKKKFTPSHTHILHFTKCDPAATDSEIVFHADAVKVASARQTVYGDKRAKKGGKLPDDVWYLRPQEAPELFDPTSDTWHIPRVCGTFKERDGRHGCQMPLAVLDRIILASSNAGQIVCDPFCGSGTTIVSAALLGRQYVGIEQSAVYVEQARGRLARAMEAKGAA
jgi:site-specific DNA-methyltransferase (adenine-specific)